MFAGSLKVLGQTDTVADIGIKAMLRFHNEVVGIGYSGRVLDVLARGIVHTECNIIIKSVVEEDGFLVDITNKLTKIVYAKVFNIDAINKHFSLLDIVISWYKVDES